MIVNGVALTPDVSGGLYWAERRLLAVADLHLEKGSSFARHGSLLPPYDSHATVGRLARVVERYDPRTVLCLGDSFHDEGAASRLDEACRASLAALARGRDWIWLAGNHDPVPPEALGGRAAAELDTGPLTFRHEPSPGDAAGEVCGHLHPCATVLARGHRLRRRCFASDGARAVLPAFGAYAGGLDVHEEAIRRLFASRFGVWLVGRDRVRHVGLDRLCRPRRIGPPADNGWKREGLSDIPKAAAPARGERHEA